MIGEVDIDSMRQTVEEFLPDLCDIYNPILEDNNAGGKTQTWPADNNPTIRNVPCELRSRLVMEQQSGGRLRHVRIFDLVMPWDTEVETSARIRMSDGRKFEVSGVSRDQSIPTEVVADVFQR